MLYISCYIMLYYMVHFMLYYMVYTWICEQDIRVRVTVITGPGPGPRQPARARSSIFGGKKFRFTAWGSNYPGMPIPEQSWFNKAAAITAF